MPKDAKDDEIIIDSYDYLGKSASSMDCTGLIPSAPKNSYELESYEAVYPFLPPRRKKAENKASG